MSVAAPLARVNLARIDFTGFLGFVLPILMGQRVVLVVLI
jgi:hypothetical protein